MTTENATLVALIGRPNVGKSTLFNRMVKRRDALVDPTPGVTRDRHYARVSWEEHPFMLVDTGGIDDEDDTITNHIRHQAMMAIEEADIIFFLMDGREGLTPSDIEIVDLLRRTEKKVFFIVNKIDSPDVEDGLLSPFWELGVEELWPLSGDHGYGFQTLMAGVLPYLETSDLQIELPENTMRIAFLGRPNVGKSSMVNTIIGQERMVVSEVAGTTRDSVDTLVTRDQYTYLLIDTAGIRRKGKTTDKLEKFSILKALKALGRCDIALVLIDAEEGITEQDTKVIGYTQDQGQGADHSDQQMGSDQGRSQTAGAAEGGCGGGGQVHPLCTGAQGVRPDRNRDQAVVSRDRQGAPPVSPALSHRRPQSAAGRRGGQS